MSSFDMSFDEYLERKARAWDLFVAMHQAGRDHTQLASELAAQCFATVDEFEAIANKYLAANRPHAGRLHPSEPHAK